MQRKVAKTRRRKGVFQEKKFTRNKPERDRNSFSPQRHRGHRVRISKNAAPRHTTSVVRFSAGKFIAFKRGELSHRPARGLQNTTGASSKCSYKLVIVALRLLFCYPTAVIAPVR